MSMAVGLEGVSKRYASGVQALDTVSFEIQAHAFVSIVGPSGCGKSTLLRLIAGLIPASAGRIEVDRAPVSGPIANAGMVFQEPVLLPWRTVLGNVLFVAEMGGRSARALRARALELLTLAGLQGFEDRLPFQLSGGMQQRTAICRALLLNPSLILMDEPFGALDIMTREQLGFELQRIWSTSRNTVIFVTHSVTEAVLLSDQVIVMTARPGRIQEIIDITLPRPRTTDTLRDPAFLDYAEHIRNCITAP